jgi:hypothetical protein
MQERAYQTAAAFTDDVRLKLEFHRSGRPLYMRRFIRAWLRQGGKTTELAKKALRQMMRNKNRLVTFASANLNIGAEMIEKEAATWLNLEKMLKANAEQEGYKLEMGEAGGAAAFRPLPTGLKWEDLAGVMEKSSLELRLWHSNSVCSRTKIIAARVQTAVSWSGTSYLDEGGKLADLQILIQEIEPIYGTDPSFTFEMAGTPPPDIQHYFNKLITPEEGDEYEKSLKPNPAGHWFKNKIGMWVHRATIDDAWLAGRKCFHPDSGEEQTPDENRETSMDKEGWDRSYRLQRSLTGTSAISAAALSTCQSLGASRGVAGQIDCAKGKGTALRHVEELLGEALKLTGNGKLTAGYDTATTESKMSNPSAFTLMEQVGMDYICRLVLWWKTADPEIAMAILEHIATLIRAAEKRVNSLTVDASNEVFFAKAVKKKIGQIMPVVLLRGNQKVGQEGEATDAKTLCGNTLVAHMESGRVPIPNHPYLENDFGRVTKAAGRFTCAVGPNGEHGDTFDSTKLALHGQIHRGPSTAKAVSVGSGMNEPRRGLLHPVAKLAARRQRRAS